MTSERVVKRRFLIHCHRVASLIFLYIIVKINVGTINKLLNNTKKNNISSALTFQYLFNCSLEFISIYKSNNSLITFNFQVPK